MTTETLARLVFDDLGTTGDIAKHAGVRPNVVANWVARWPDFPAPLGRIGKATVWHLPTVREYLKGK